MDRCYMPRWRKVGEYDDASQSFTIKEIPAPPEAKPHVDTDPLGRTTRIGWRMRCACPSCLKPIEFGWSGEVVSEHVHMARAFGEGGPSSAVVAMAAIANAQEHAGRADHAERRMREAYAVRDAAKGEAAHLRTVLRRVGGRKAKRRIAAMGRRLRKAYR